MIKKRKIKLALSIIPAFLVIKLLSYFPNFVETFYSEGFYPIISKMSRYAFGWIPFSVGDIIYTIAGIYTIRWLYINRKRIVSETINWVLDVLTVVSFIYIGFHLFWGLNYYRVPIHEKLGLNHTYTTEELIATTENLIKITNSLHLELVDNDSVKVIVPYSKNELITKSNDAFLRLEEFHPSFSFKRQSTKRSIYSLPLTYMGFSGYLNPYTNEAQIDGLIPLYQYPFTICHEQAHQLGYAAENEVNFISFLSTTSSEDNYIKYSGYAAALRYCLNEVYYRNEAQFKTLKETLNEGVLENYRESQDFWKRYQNPLEPVFKKIYSNFLKVNNQDKGIESYSYVVALLVNYHKKTDTSKR